MLLSSCAGWVVDINGAVLLEEFKERDPEMYMDIPEGMQMLYTTFTEQVVAMVKKCINGTKQLDK